MRPLLVINPLTDASFVDETKRLMREGELSPDDLQRELRKTYPRAVVRIRGLSAELDETWYVYREGSWIPSGKSENGKSESGERDSDERSKATSRPQPSRWRPLRSGSSRSRA